MKTNYHGNQLRRKIWRMVNEILPEYGNDIDGWAVSIWGERFGNHYQSYTNEQYCTIVEYLKNLKKGKAKKLRKEMKVVN